MTGLRTTLLLATRSARDLLVKGVLPGLGGLMLTAVFAQTLKDMWDPAYGSGSSVFGIGSVFVIGVGLLLVGVVLMAWMHRRSPAFFRGEVLTKEGFSDHAGRGAPS